MAVKIVALLIGIFFVEIALSTLSGAWKRWDNVKQVKSDAFSAGTDSSGNEIYIGRGLFKGILTPGRMRFQDSPGKPAGVYTKQGKLDSHCASGVEYLTINPKCTYQWVPSSFGKFVKNAVITGSGRKIYYVGRVTSEGSLQIGQVLFKDKMYYPPSNKATSYEVLVCQLNPPTTTTIAPPAPTDPPADPTTTTIAPAVTDPPADPTTTTIAPAPTDPPADPTTTTIAPAPIDPSSEPTPCTTTCSSSILDTIGCRCCEFADYSRYSTLKSELSAIEAKLESQTIDSVTQANIDALKQNLADIESQVVSTCGSEPPSTITASFEYADQNLAKLKLSLETFDFQFNPNKCTLSCDEAGGFVPVWKRCECIYFEGYEKLIAYKGSYNELFGNLIVTTYDTVQYYTENNALAVEYSFLYSVINGFQWNWDDYTAAEKTAKITEVTTKTEALIIRINTYINSNAGSCGKVCEFSLIAESTNGCQCYGSQVTIDFYTSFDQVFKYLENEIFNRNFREFTAERDYFQNWANQLRAKAVTFYTSIAETSQTTEQKQTMATEFINEVDRLKVEWEEFKPKLVVTCSVTCSGDTVKTCNPCECAAVSGWENLINVISPDISVTLTDIDSLVLDDVNKDKLRANANTVSSGITQIKSYVDDTSNCNSLDVDSVRSASQRLTGLYSDLLNQIITVKNSASSDTCSTSCPSNWIVTKSPCGCKCLPITCDSSIQAIDAYNCQCATKTSCAETQSNCEAQSLLLDYAECTCKAKP
jgi:hypothetical protein